MPLRGEVYFPDKTLPPGQAIPHRCVILSNSSLIATQPNTNNNKFFVTVALIRSALNQTTKQSTRLVKGHSIPISVRDLSSLTHDSIVETHQVFSVELDAFKKKTPEGRISGQVLIDILEGAKLIFS